MSFHVLMKLSVVSSQLQRALLVDRVEQKQDHVMVYVREVRGIHSGVNGGHSPDLLLILSSVFPPTVTKGHSHPPQLRAHTGAPSAEPEASCGQDLRLLPAK